MIRIYYLPPMINYNGLDERGVNIKLLFAGNWTGNCFNLEVR